VTFESVRCLQCDSALGFDWDAREIVAPRDRPRCAGNRRAGCNGLVHEDGVVRELRADAHASG
jgi:hypothetical protein